MVLYLEMTLKLHHVSSLKEKRSVVKSILSKTRQKHNISSAELAYHDDVSYTKLGFVGVGKQKSNLEKIMHEIIHFIETNYQLDLIEYDLIELI